MGDKPEVSEEALKGANLKKAETHLASNAPDKALLDNIKGQWQGTIEATQATDAYKGINWNESWVEQLKAKPAEEQADFFANGVATGLAFAE